MTEIKDVLAERGARYGSYVEHAAMAMWLKDYVQKQLNRRQKTIPSDQHYAIDMICVKLARIINGDPDYPDNWLDIAGYATLVANRLTGNTPKTEQKVFHGKTLPEPGDDWKYVRELERDGDYGHYLFERTVSP